MGVLAAAYAVLKSGIPWSAPGPPKSKCTGYAVANPGEARLIDAYVAALDAGQRPAPPQLTTATGRGLVGMLAELAATSAPPSALKVTIAGTPQEGQKLTAVIS